MYLLDTDHLSLLQIEDALEKQRLLVRLNAVQADQFVACIVSFHEQTSGWNGYLNSAKKRSDLIRGYSMLRIVLADFSQIKLLDFDIAAAIQFELLRKQGVRIGTLDLRIASIALVHDCTVLTRNLRDFRKVPGLKVEDWTL
jgi:tRNA(fMet)-specific endonuclease VapC